MSSEPASKSVVLLRWFNKGYKESDKEKSTTTTGFVFHKEEKHIHILSSASQCFPGISKENMTVEVVFYDGTERDGIITLKDESVDFSGVSVELEANVLAAHPFSCINACSFTHNPLRHRQSLFSVHHPSMGIPGTTTVLLAPFQETDGFIADPSYQGTGFVHIHLPSMMDCSYGAPIFDRATNHVVCMFKEFQLGTSCNGSRQEVRMLGIPASTIIQFLKSYGLDV